jgi:hypothetical protein
VTGERKVNKWRDAQAKRDRCERSSQRQPKITTSARGRAASDELTERNGDKVIRRRGKIIFALAALTKRIRLGIRQKCTRTLTRAAGRDKLKAEHDRVANAQARVGETLLPRETAGSTARDRAAGRSDRRATSSPVTILTRDNATQHEALSRHIPISISVRPTYQASAAKPSGARFRQLQAVVGRRGRDDVTGCEDSRGASSPVT